MPGPVGRAGASRDAVRHRAWARAVLRTYGEVCWLCGHGGARQADHVQAATERPELEYAVSNGRPAHGAPGNPCPVCSQAAGRGVYCNQLRGMGSVERARRLIRELTRLAMPGDDQSADPQESGRDW